MNAILRSLVATTLTLVAWSLPLAAATIEPHHSALWYDPARDGEGFVLEVYADDHALLTWYTYDDAGKQRWLTGFGSVVVDDDGNEHLHFSEMLAPRGGRFGPNFDPAQVQRVPVGEITLRFDDCWRGAVDYTVFGQTGTINLHRLTRTMGATCGPIHGTTGEPVQAYAGQSGAWYDPAHDGEGWLLQWLAEGEAIVTWFTYTPQGEPYWLIGTGTMEDGRIVFPQLQTTRGARFGAAFDPDDVERIDWGSLELAIDCDAGTMRYESMIPGFGEGGLDDLIHLSRLAQPACPWVAPKLTDLYDFALTRFEIDPDVPGGLPDLVVRDMADDGTVIASGRMEGDGTEDRVGIFRLSAGDGAWQHLPDPDPIGSEVRISPGADLIISSSRKTTQSGIFDTKPIFWQDDESRWRLLPGLLTGFRALPLTGMSPNSAHVLGRAAYEDTSVPDRAWIWDAENGQVLLPASEDVLSPYPTTASDDGRIVYGTRVLFPYNSSFARQGAIRWVDGQAPEPLYDTQGAALGLAVRTDASGRVVFGFDHVLVDNANPNSRQAWYWISPEKQAYLGTFDDGWTDNARPWWVGDVTHDGSMAVGNYTITYHDGEGFIWTQDTGLTSIREVLVHGGLLEELERTGPWRERAATRISSNGDKILLEGRTSVPFGGASHRVNYGAILHLTPKARPEPE